MNPSETLALRRRSPITWNSLGEEPALIYDIGKPHKPFLCFFLKADASIAAPKISFDSGQGFNELASIVFRPLPLGFYHVASSTIGAAKRLSLRPVNGAGRFHLLVFESDRPLFVAVLHYLFNLRYQRIALVTADKANAGPLATIAANVRRIRKFFSDVSVGGGVRVQQADDDLLAKLRLAQTVWAPAMREAVRQRLDARPSPSPLISVVCPVYNTDPAYLRDLLGSFLAEEATYCELVISDDGSTSQATREEVRRAASMPDVRVIDNPSNGGIAVATNAGIAAARGEWVTFIDHDDAFEAGALAAIATAILDHPDATFFYTDEVVSNAALKPIGSFCKPAYDPVLLSGMNYINHFSVYRRDRLMALDGLRLDREGSQDYDLLLRYLAGAKAGDVVHIPYLAYSWRRGEGSYSAVFRERSLASAREALVSTFADLGETVTVDPAPQQDDLHRLRFKNPQPLVSIIIPNRESFDLLARLVDDLERRTDYRHIEIIIIDNGSRESAVLDLYARKRGPGFVAEVATEAFNFARMCNRGARLASGDLLLFLNNDIEVIEPGWLAEMVECLSYSYTGVVGAKLLYPNGTLQHAGVIVGLGDAAGHWHVEAPVDEPGPMGRLAVRQTLTAVTGACMLVTRACFESVSGFDEATFPIAYNDIDFCIRARRAGFRTVWTPFACLTHHESASRGSDETGENNLRFKEEMRRLQERHGTVGFIDDAYSPFYDRRYARPTLINLPEPPQPRANDLG